MEKDVQYFLEDIFHVSSLPVYKTVRDINRGMWIVFIIEGDIPPIDIDTDLNEEDLAVHRETLGTVVAEVTDYRGRKQFLYTEWTTINYDSKVNIFGTKSKDIAEAVAHKIRKLIKNENRSVKLVLLDQDKYKQLNKEIKERVTTKLVGK